MTLDPANLVLRIQESFGDMPYPGDEHIVLDNSGSNLESEQIRNALKGRHWRDVPFQTLNELASALPFLSPEGYHFYLPAFMIYSIVDFPAAGVIPDEVVRTLTLPRRSDVDRIRELAKLHPELQPFSSDEWEQILKTMTETHDSGRAQRMFFERVSGFSPEQRKAILEFLEYLRDVHGDEFPNREPETAIERYWGRKDTDP